MIGGNYQSLPVVVTTVKLIWWFALILIESPGRICSNKRGQSASRFGLVHVMSERVLKCSSLMGLSASHLLDPKDTKPSYKVVWDKPYIRYQVSSRQSIERHSPHCAFLAVRGEDPWREKARLCL